MDEKTKTIPSSHASAIQEDPFRHNQALYATRVSAFFKSTLTN